MGAAKSRREAGKEAGGEALELATRLHSAAIHLLRALRREDAAMGISPSRASALSVLGFGGPRALGELAAAEQVTAPTMSKLVAALEAEGLVAREPDPRDGRAVRLRATAAGMRLLERGRARRTARLAARLEELGAKERATIERAVALLEKLLPDL